VSWGPAADQKHPSYNTFWSVGRQVAGAELDSKAGRVAPRLQGRLLEDLAHRRPEVLAEITVMEVGTRAREGELGGVAPEPHVVSLRSAHGRADLGRGSQRQRHTPGAGVYLAVYKASFDPATLAPRGVSPFGTDPYLSPRFITNDGTVYLSGEMFGSNDTQVAPGLWVTLGGTLSMFEGPVSEVSRASGFLAGGLTSRNDFQRPSIAFHLPGDDLLSDPPHIITKGEYEVDINDRFLHDQIRTLRPQFVLYGESTVDMFLAD